MGKSKLVILSLPAFCFSVSAWSSETANSVATPAALAGQMLFGLGIVIAAIYLLAWFTKKLNGHTLKHANGLKLLACLPLGTKEKAVLIDAAGTKILLGVSQGGINALHVYAKSESENDGEEEHQHDSQEKPLAQLQPQIGVNSLGQLAARSTSEFSKKLNAFLKQGNRTP